MPPSSAKRHRSRNGQTWLDIAIGTVKRQNPRRIGVLLVGIGLLVWLGWQIIGNTVADTTARNDPLVSLRWRPTESSALVALAESRLSAPEADEQTEQIVELARRALQADPLQEGALRLLALSAEKNGQPELARTLMELAAGRSLRDTKALVWLFDQRIRENRPADALGYVDAILRTRPDLEGAFANSLVTFATVPAARPALVKLLGSNPPWRQWLLGRLAATASEPETTYAILSNLALTANPPRDSELKPYLDRLISDGQYQLAFLAWLHFLPTALSQTVPFVFNGDFEQPVSGLPFDWVITPIKGASTDIVETGGKDPARALRVVFADTRVPYRQVNKLLVLPPGRYQFSGQVKADHLVNERGVTWRIFCAEDNKVTLTTSDPVVGTNEWHSFAVTFDVPSAGCSAQWLRLELAARFPIEEQVSGAVWYGKLAIRWATADAEAISQSVH